MYFLLKQEFVLPGYSSGILHILKQGDLKCDRSCNMSLEINRRYVKYGNVDVILYNLFQVNRWSKSKEPKTPKGCLCVIRYKGHSDLKSKLLKRYGAYLLLCISLSNGRQHQTDGGI